MKIIKKILIILWAILTFGLIIYSQKLRTESEIQRNVNKELITTLTEMSKGLTEYYDNMQLLRNDTLSAIDIDSLFKSSFYLTKFEEKSKNLLNASK